MLVVGAKLGYTFVMFGVAAEIRAETLRSDLITRSILSFDRRRMDVVVVQ